MIRFPPKKLLVAADTSEPSLAALQAAKTLARRLDAGLDVVYVHEVLTDAYVLSSDYGITTTPNIAAQVNDFRKWREEKLRRLVGTMPPGRLKVRSIVGPPAVVLSDLAKRGAADMIVMGTHGYAGMDRVFFGSVAEAVLRKSDVPVLTVHEGRSLAKISRILVPYNMTHYAGRALIYALSLAHAVNARVDVLYVALPGERVDGISSALGRSLESLLGQKTGDGLRAEVLQGNPRRVILERAEKGGYDLVVLSAHRTHLLTDVVLGSTVERVLRHSTVPMLGIPSLESVIRKPAANKASGRIY